MLWFSCPVTMKTFILQILFICMHIYIGQKSMLGIFLNSSPANFLRQVISLNLEFTNLARPSGHQGPTRTLPGLYMDAEHLNSGARGLVASTLLIEHCSWPLQLFLVYFRHMCILLTSMYTRCFCSDCRG